MNRLARLLALAVLAALAWIVYVALGLRLRDKRETPEPRYRALVYCEDCGGSTEMRPDGTCAKWGHQSIDHRHPSLRLFDGNAMAQRGKQARQRAEMRLV